MQNFTVGEQGHRQECVCFCRLIDLKLFGVKSGITVSLNSCLAVILDGVAGILF